MAVRAELKLVYCLHTKARSKEQHDDAPIFKEEDVHSWSRTQEERNGGRKEKTVACSVNGICSGL